VPYLFYGPYRNEATSILQQLVLLVLFTNINFVTTFDSWDIPPGKTAEPGGSIFGRATGVIDI
jgi:hypothetical protein